MESEKSYLHEQPPVPSVDQDKEAAEQEPNLHPEVTNPEFAWAANQAVNEELDAAYEDFQAARESGKYTKMQERDVMGLVMRKRRLGEEFGTEMQQAIAGLSEGEKPTLPISEKGVANMYLAGHLFGKDVTVQHIAECLAKGKEVTESMEYPESGSRYFKLEIPEGAGMPGMFILPSESGRLGELVANLNLKCESKIRHGNIVSVIKKKDIPQFIVDLESSIYVIVQKNTREDGSLQIADGPTENDPEGDWIIATAHYGEPSRRKPRPPKVETIENLYAYAKQKDAWEDEQRRKIFVDLEEEGVGQEGPKQKTTRVSFEERNTKISALENTVDTLTKIVMNLSAENQELRSLIKGLETRQKSKK